MALALNGNSDAVARRILESDSTGEIFPVMALDDSPDDGKVREQVWKVSERLGLPELYQQILPFVLPADDVQSVIYDERSTYEMDEIDDDAMMRVLGMDKCWTIDFVLEGGRELEMNLATKNGRIGVERLHEVVLGVMVSLPNVQFSTLWVGLGGPLSAHFDLLRSPHCNLTSVRLPSSGLNDELVIALANSLVGNRTLRRLNLSINPDVTTVGWSAIACILSQPLSHLESLCLMRTSINDEVVNVLADALVRNSHLRNLNLTHNNAITTAGLEVFLRVLCNPASILATYDSNHTLQSLTWCTYWKESAKVKALLQLNLENSSRDSARLKIIETHFPEDDSMPLFQELDAMEPAVVPDAVAWMGRDKHLYLFLRKMPWLLSKLTEAALPREALDG